MDKKIYIVNGSEDGRLGVYSNLKKAYEKAIQYGSWKDNRNLKSYVKVCKEFKDNDYWCWEVEVDSNYDRLGGATIELHYLNAGRYGEG